MFGSVRELARTLLSFAETRARLAANEFEEQLLRLYEIWAWTVAAAMLIALALIMASVFVLLAFWDSHRLLAAGALTLLYLAGGLAALRVARARNGARPRILGTTIEELKRDREHMEGKP